MTTNADLARLTKAVCLLLISSRIGHMAVLKAYIPRAHRGWENFRSLFMPDTFTLTLLLLAIALLVAELVMWLSVRDGDLEDDDA